MCLKNKNMAEEKNNPSAKKKDTRETEILAFLKQTVLFAKAKPQDLKKVCGVVKDKVFARGSIIFLENEPGHTFFIIQSGLIKIARSAPDGRMKTLNILGPGYYFGEMAVLDEPFRSATAEALLDSYVYVIYKQDFETLIEKNPHIALDIIHTLIQRLRHADQQIEDLTFTGSKERVVKTLVKLSEQFGKKQEDNIHIPIHLTHQEIAEMAGLSRETTTRLLNEMEKDGLLNMEKHHITILNDLKFRKLLDTKTA